MILRSFGEYLVKRGRHVQVVTERPINRDEFKIPASPSRETVAGMDVIRLRRLPFTASNRGVRLLDRLAFAPRVVFMGLRLRIRGVRYDFVWAATTPPIVNGLAALAVSRLLGARLVYHVQDIIPELGVHSGHWKEGSSLYRLLFAMDNFTARHARVCIVLSEDMRTTLLIRGLPPEKIVTISNFMPGEFTSRDRRPIHNNLDKSSKIFRVIYAGKISRFQGLETMVHAARLLEREAPEVEFVVLGEGVALPNLKRLAAGLSNIRFVPYMAFEAASVLITTADLGLVSVRPGIYRAAYPSKTLTYLALGVPLLAVVDSENALARMVRRDEVGIVVEGWSGRAIADSVLAARRGPVEHWRAKAELVHRRDFSTTALLRQWDGVVERLA